MWLYCKACLNWSWLLLQKTVIAMIFYRNRLVKTKNTGFSIKIPTTVGLQSFDINAFISILHRLYLKNKVNSFTKKVFKITLEGIQIIHPVLYFSATCFRIAKASDQCKECLLKSAECNKQNRSYPSHNQILIYKRVYFNLFQS